MKAHPHLATAIANVLEKNRIQRKMSKSSLADFADIERSYLRDITKAKKKPTVNTIFCLCEALQIDPLEFFKEVVHEVENMKDS